MTDSGQKPGNFAVTDRRAFDASGDLKAEPSAAPDKPAGGVATNPEPPHALPPADFATLVLSLGSSAVMYLGEGPEDEKTPRNLPMAKHAIDLLTVLEDKTRGNLSAEEENVLGSLLFDLRLRYVEALKASPSGG